MDYTRDEETAKQFLSELPKYSDLLPSLARGTLRSITIELSDLEVYDPELATNVSSDTDRYVRVFSNALDTLLANTPVDIVGQDPWDLFIKQRKMIAEKSGATYPSELMRRYHLYFKPSSSESIPIRQVKSKFMGSLISVKGVVTRATEIKPKVKVACYICDQCGSELFQIVEKDFTPISQCSSEICKANKTLGRITMLTRGSKLIKAQELKIQEPADQVSTGDMPRTLTIQVHGELVRSCVPGDNIMVSGIHIPNENTRYKMRSGGLTCDYLIDAHNIVLLNKTDNDEITTEPMSEEEAANFISGETGFLNKLANSIAPEIFGHEELKKALLLLLVGGVDTNPSGVKIRGNINICLMGDPGVAKSQLLSFIERLATRSQYTTGRGSSGIGLTAAVLKDPMTNEMVLEGGALVLADGGICCIDEFDKMMEADRTAIHEVMEQQTVSIAKAGIMTTLNARVSILAAANPAYGRYNVHRSVSENLELPPALLSRFDLLWLIKDRPKRTNDLALSAHVLEVHRNPNEKPPSDFDSIDLRTMRRYINLCKTRNPTVPVELTDKLLEVYSHIRADCYGDQSGQEDALFTSPRSLLAIIRLSTALARLRLASEVDRRDIDAALQLYDFSRTSIGKVGVDKPTLEKQIYDFIKHQTGGKAGETVRRISVVNQFEGEGYDRKLIDQALDNLMEFESLFFERNIITFVG